MKRFDFWDWIHVLLIVVCLAMLFVSKLTKFSDYGMFVVLIGGSTLVLSRGRVSKTIYNPARIVLTLLAIVWFAWGMSFYF